MAETERESLLNNKRLPVVLILVLVVVLGSFAFTAGTPTVPSNVCTPGNQLCDQIVFDQSAYGNASMASPVLTSTSFTATLNATLVVMADSNIGGAITGITDAGSDIFTSRLTLSQNCPPCQNFEIWTAKTKIPTGTVSTITVTWNATTNNVFVMASYLNVAGIGNATGTNFPGSNSGSTIIMPAFSGSKIVGGIGISPPSGATCTSAVPGTFVTQRVDSCSQSAIPEVEVATGDNMTVLRNTQAFTFAYSSNNNLTPAVQIGAIELIGFDKEPSFPNFNNFCTTTNGLCVTTQYAINAVRQATGANALNKGLALNTAYCTGITTASLTLSAAHNVFAWANYGGVDLNTTSAKVMVQFYVSTNVPSTTFASGLCATGGLIVGVGYLFFPISGSLSATNAFTVSINGICSSAGSPCNAANTLYGWLEVTAQNFALGSLGFDQVTNQVYSTSSINLMEIK